RPGAAATSRPSRFAPTRPARPSGARDPALPSGNPPDGPPLRRRKGAPEWSDLGLSTPADGKPEPASRRLSEFRLGERPKAERRVALLAARSDPREEWPRGRVLPGAGSRRGPRAAAPYLRRPPALPRRRRDDDGDRALPHRGPRRRARRAAPPPARDALARARDRRGL